MRREKIFSTHFIQRVFGTFMIAIMSSVTFVALTSCTNIGSLKKLAASINSSSTTSTGAVGTFTLLTVVPTQVNNGSTYDAIGQNGEFDTYCSTITNCKCQFTYTLSGVTGTTTSQGALVYEETNLIRCTNSVPIGVSVFDLSIVTVDGTNYTNQIQVSLANGVFSGSTSYLDLSNALSFSQVNRFQCRKREFITDPLDSNMIDPLQSEDPRVNYAFNYYTTNLSESLLQYQQQGNQNWDCSITGQGAVQAWANANVFSQTSCTDSFCSGDGELIYPQTSLMSGKIPVSNPAVNGKKRSSFALAKQAFGSFTIPVQAAAAPKDYVSSIYQTIGYAASAIPSTTGGTSSCPAITLSPKAYWVKLWNFQATNITPPLMVKSSNSTQISGIACNTQAGDFPSCDEQPKTLTHNFTTNPLSNISTTPTPDPSNLYPMASRVVVLGANNGTTNACYGIDNISSWLNGGENWIPSGFGFGGTINSGSLSGLPWGLYSTVTGQCTSNDSNNLSQTWVTTQGTPPTQSPTPAACDGSYQVVPTGPATDNQIQTSALAGATSNYTDQLFVVTSTSVSDSAMINQSGSIYEYVPVTFRQSSDCSGATHDTCSSSTQINWGINSNAVGTTSSGATFPLCVVQFYD